MSNTAIKSPAELVAAVPAVLGFHPVDSLTALWTDTSGSLVWTLRHDLDTPVEQISDRLVELAGRTSPG